MRILKYYSLVYHIGIDTCLNTTKAPIIGAFVVSLHLQVARWLLPSVTSTEKQGGNPIFCLDSLKC